MNNTLKYFLISIYMAGSLLLSSCGGPVYNAYQKVQEGTWKQTDAYTFEVNIPDAGRYALFFNIRYNEKYSWSNIWIRADLQHPTGKSISQRFNIPLFSPEGYPLQDALGATYFRQFPAQHIEQMLLPFDAEQPGKYVFKLHQDMRSAQLTGIDRIGLQLKRMEH